MCSPPKVAANEARFALQARSLITACIASARLRQWRARSSSPMRAAIFARRSHAAQHITLEKVWTCRAPRSSQGPASGWS